MSHQIPKLKCFLYPLAVVFAQSIEARCQVENEDVVGAAPTGATYTRGFMVGNVYAHGQAMGCIIEPRKPGIEYPETSVSICTFAAANFFKISFSLYILFLIQTAS